MNSGKLLAGILAGFAAGAVVGILFAPEKGTNTRKQIMDKGENYADDLKSKFDDFVESLNKKYQSAIEKTKGMPVEDKQKQEEINGEKAVVSGL